MKTYIITASLIVFSCVLVAAYSIFNVIFPYCESFSSPNVSEITNYSIVYRHDNQEEKVEAEIDLLLEFFEKSKPTRKTSYNDYPNTNSYYEVKINLSTNIYTYFIYQSYFSVLLEKPYYGVFSISRDVLELLKHP